ncbi:RHS repeat domain-containing protein, partial [Photorhabdus akhurstii]|uniref:RHS repeat domain-containing protein n=1 Tax=Photorhabdus akhurstii TaxID=171438 RepID=UPI003634ABFD
KRVPERLSEDLRQSYHTQQAGRVIQHGACTYRYDENGRRTEKTEQRRGYRPRTWRYRWDAQDRLTGFISPEGVRWRYGYDAFGRRISKRKETDTAGPPVKPTAIIGYDYLWSGEQLIEETPVYADGTVGYEQSIHWLYEPGALTPSARYQQGQLYYVVSDHQGTVREILTEAGELIWAGRLLTWGEPERWPVLTINDPRNLTCNLRFCGQYEDSESGLFYNRHRYYESDTGQYLSPDPLNLSGGINPYGYVHDPVNWIDPFGLSSFDPFIHGDITDFPKDLHFGQNRIAPNFSSIGSQADPLITGRPILDVANDIKVGKISPDTFVISYTIDPATGKPVTLNNRGLAAIVESGKFPQSAIYVPYEHVPKHLVADILDRPPSRSIDITHNKDGSGLVKTIGCKK